MGYEKSLSFTCTQLFLCVNYIHTGKIMVMTGNKGIAILLHNILPEKNVKNILVNHFACVTTYMLLLYIFYVSYSTLGNSLTITKHIILKKKKKKL